MARSAPCIRSRRRRRRRRRRRSGDSALRSIFYSYSILPLLSSLLMTYYASSSIERGTRVLIPGLQGRFAHERGVRKR